MLSLKVFSRTYTNEEAKSAWAQLEGKKISEKNFKEACDLIQDVGQTNLNLAYQFLTEYFSVVKTTGNKQWLHVLLMNWARAKESLTAFDEADSLYRLARTNAIGHVKNYDEALVSTVLMYLEWGKGDSLEKYLKLGENSCRQNNDDESLSFIYTFKGLANMDDTASFRKYLDSAIVLAQKIADKNALFTAKYNRAVFYSQFNLQQQVTELGELQDLCKDPSLSHKPRFYERTAFYFRSPVPSIYYQLMLVNLMLTDYDNAWKFAELFYDATVKPNPTGAQAAPVNSVMAMVKAYQGAFDEAMNYLSKSFSLFNQQAGKISYPTYHLAAGMIAEHENRKKDALEEYELAYKNGSMAYGLHLMPPEIYYAHELIMNNQTDSARKLFAHLSAVLKTRTYSAIGFYYYKYYAELLKATNDNAGYNRAIEIFYTIKDSLSNINRYRAIQEVETKMRVHDKEQQIMMLNKENETKKRELRQQWAGILIFSALSALIIALLIAYARNQNHRKLQAEQIAHQNEVLQQHKIAEMRKQHRIEIMQGTIDAEENERYKIADQLHDEAGGMLALASLNISSAIEKGFDDLRAKEKIEKAHEILNDVSSTIRAISHRLTPLVIEKYGFKKAIEDMAQSINLSGKLKMQTTIIGFDDDKKYPIGLLNNIYRIIQELVHNILKHADALSAMIEVVEHEKQVAVMVEDDGIGIEDYPSSKGKGLQSIQAKIAYLNGKMQIEKKQDKGTLIVFEINVG